MKNNEKKRKRKEKKSDKERDIIRFLSYNK